MRPEFRSVVLEGSPVHTAALRFPGWGLVFHFRPLIGHGVQVLDPMVKVANSPSITVRSDGRFLMMGG